MWSLPSSVAIPIGNPLAGLSLLEMAAVTVVVAAGVCVFLLARSTRAGRQVRIVRCPADGADALIVVRRTSARSSLRVIYCSRNIVRSAKCDRGCLRRVA